MAGIQHLIYKNAKVCLTMRNLAPFQQLFYKLNQMDWSFCMTGLSVNIYQRCGFTAGNQKQTGGSLIYGALLYHLSPHERSSVIAQTYRGVYQSDKCASSSYISTVPT